MRQQIKLLEQTPMGGTLSTYQPLEIIKVDKTETEPLWDHMVRNYHYLGYDKTIGARIKYLALHSGTPIAAISYNRAALKTAARDAYLGWNPEQKQELLRHVVNNNRFLILPWVRIKNLASHLLSRTLKMLQTDWPLLYGADPYIVETFVDNERHKGTCYIAANWLYLGETKGYGKIGRAFVYHGNRKGVYIYTLNKTFIKSILNDPRRQSLKKAEGKVPAMMLQKMDWNPVILEEAGITPEAVEGLGSLLCKHLERYGGCFTRSEQRDNAARYVKGLLSDLDRKSIEPIALRYCDEKGVRAMQNFAQNGVLDDAGILSIYQAQLSSAIADPGGMITVDGCDFPKKGVESAGVARQYCGALGKIDNCQAGVFIGYTSKKGYGLIDKRLYLPEQWFDDLHSERFGKCGIPKGTEFETKPKMAAGMIRNVAASGMFPARWVGADAGFGCDKDFLDSIPDGMHYFADIKANMLVFNGMPDVSVPPYGGKGRRDLKAKPSFAPVPVSGIAANDDACTWASVVLGEGAKGPIIADEKCVRVVDCRDGLPGEWVWLYIRRYANGTLRFSLCNAPAGTKLETIRDLAIMRWPIEQCFEECKSYLGMDHYEGRSWNAWHRHMMFVFIAHLILLDIRLTLKKTIRC